MARKRRKSPASGNPRKSRTRAHVIADSSANFVERLALKCGYVVHREHPDHGFDLRLVTFDERGNIEGESVAIQLKATDSVRQYQLVGENVFSFPVETKDYRLWCDETVVPVFLILYDAVMEEAYWLDIQSWDRDHQPQRHGDTIHVHIPCQQVLGIQTVRLMRQRKQQVLERTRNELEQEG